MPTETVTITASFGSDMQRDVAMRILRKVLAEWEGVAQVWCKWARPLP